MDEFRKQIIKNWIKRAHERYISLRPGFDNFFDADNLIFCSISYEAYAFGKFQKSTVADNRKEIGKTFQKDFEKLVENQNSPSDFKEALNNLKSEIDNLPLKDMTPNSNKSPLCLPDKKELDRILEIIYRVRSNLLHGGKEVDPSFQRNMILIKSSFIILYHVMNLILGQEGLA